MCKTGANPVVPYWGNVGLANYADFETLYSAYEAEFGPLEITWESATLPSALDFSVSATDVTEPVEGVAQMTFTVTLNGPQEEEVTLGFLVSSETAI